MVENSGSQNKSAPRENDSKRTIVIVVIAILLSVNGLLLWQFFSKKNSLEKVSASLQTTLSEKESLSAELNQMKIEYEKVSAENEELHAQLLTKDEEIRSKMAEIERLINSGDAAKLRQARNEITRLKQLNEGYVSQIDSLNTLNTALSAENTDLNQSLLAEQSRVQNLTKENTLLTNKVAIGAALKATDMNAVGVKYRSSGKELQTSKASSVDKIRTCCTVLQNLVADGGHKKAYLRVLSPDGAVMSTSSETFMYNNQATLYTMKEQFEYNNEDTELCFYWSKGSQYSKGKYTIEIYCEGNLIGSAGLTLK